MKFRDLLESGLISDSDVVRLRVEIRDETRKFTGNWYEDGILNCMDLEVHSMSRDQEWGAAGYIWEIGLGTESVEWGKSDAGKAVRAVCETQVPPSGDLIDVVSANIPAAECAATEGETC